MNGDDAVREGAASLLEFVKRASKKDAAPEEVAVLPEAARVLLEFCKFI